MDRIKGYLIDKIISLLVSFKVWLIAVSTILLVKGQISDSIYKDIVLGIALGRVLVQGIETYKTGKFNDLPKSPEDAKTS